MRRATIRTKLVLLLAIPLVALVVLAALGVTWTSDAAARSRATVDGAEAALASTRAALEVARERGLAAAALSDPDGDSARELRHQRGQVDNALADAARAVSSAGGADERATVDEVAAAVDAVRARVDTGEATATSTRDDYSASVDQLLSSAAESMAAIDDADLLGTVTSYTALVQVANAVALQQSLLYPAYTVGVLDGAVRDRVVAASAVEATWQQRFEDIADAEARAALDVALDTPSVSAADRLRDEALAVGVGGPMADDGDLWLSSTTRKGDLVASVAGDLGAELRDAAEADGAAAERTRALLIGLGLAALALIVALVALLQRMVVRPIRELTTAAHRVATDVLPQAVAVAHSSGPDAAEGVAVPIEAPSRDELGDLTDAFNAVQRTAVGLASEQAMLRRNVSEVFVNLGRRTQNLITRQLEHIDHLEERTDEPDTLADLFLLDHLSTRLRRNAENMLVLAGAESPRPWARPVSIVNVVRAAMAESTDYARVDLVRVEPAAVVGAAVSDVSHLLAELVDNALAFSPPTERVVVTGRHVDEGRYGVVIEDAGLGMPPDRMARANARIAAPPVDDFSVSRFLGLYVVGRLAARHGAEVVLGPSRFGGVAAHVLLPAALMVVADRPGAPGGPPVGSPNGGPTRPPTPSPAYNRLATGARHG